MDLNSAFLNTIKINNKPNNTTNIKVKFGLINSPNNWKNNIVKKIKLIKD